jgi:hypothetical protein
MQLRLSQALLSCEFKSGRSKVAKAGSLNSNAKFPVSLGYFIATESYILFSIQKSLFLKTFFWSTTQKVRDR